jgi:hypothetical protein
MADSASSPVFEPPPGGAPDQSTAGDLVTRLAGEGLIGMATAARRLGTFRGGKCVHPSTLTRWARHGVRTPDGRLVRLETVRLSNRLCTSWPAVLRFLAAQQPNEACVGPTVPLRSPAERRRESEAADAALRAMGVK